MDFLPVAAWVGVSVGDAGIARVGWVEVEGEQPVRLHVVLQGETEGGESVFATKAAGVQFDRELVVRFGLPSFVDADQLLDPALLFEESKPVRMLWQTIESSHRFLEIESADRLDLVDYQPFYHPEMGSGWSADPRLEVQFEPELASESVEHKRDFGTQLFQVWVEMFATPEAVIPELRFKSPGPGYHDLEPLPEAGRLVTAMLKKRSGFGSDAPLVFGRLQIRSAQGVEPAVDAAVAELQALPLISSPLEVLRDHIAARGSHPEELSWELVDLEVRPPITRFRPGDLLQVGSRWVLYLEDRGEVGILDGQDLCLDFEEGSTVRRIEEVFVGVGDIEWAALGER